MPYNKRHVKADDQAAGERLELRNQFVFAGFFSHYKVSLFINKYGRELVHEVLLHLEPLLALDHEEMLQHQLFRRAEQGNGGICNCSDSLAFLLAHEFKDAQEQRLKNQSKRYYLENNSYKKQRGARIIGAY